MAPHPADSGDLSHNSGAAAAHPSAVTRAPATINSVSGAARSGRQFYNTLSASSVGLELGLAVVFGVLFGRWLDGKLGTAPWMMLLFFALGLAAGFRSVLRAVRRADRAAEAEAHRG
jgi:F0F1-type ATP synthase assembly protein I